MTYVWYRTYFGARAVRATLLAKQCDAMIGLPDSDAFMGPKVIFSKPLFSLGYAIVASNGQSFASVEDLKGKRVAVQFETEPHNIVGPRDDMTPVTVVSAEEGMKALADGRADAAFLWPPTAGYLNRPPMTAASRSSRSTARASPGRLRSAIPRRPRACVTRRRRAPGNLEDVPGAVRQIWLRDRRPGRRENRPDREGGGRGGAGRGARRAPAPAKRRRPRPAPTQTATVETGARDPGKPAGDGTGEFDVAPAAPAATPEMIAEGKEMFNGICAHCHGPDAVMGQEDVDLRRLTLRYGDGAHNMFWKTVHEGRPAKGMPTWKGVFTDSSSRRSTPSCRRSSWRSEPIPGAQKSVETKHRRDDMRIVAGGASAAMIALAAAPGLADDLMKKAQESFLSPFPRWFRR